MNWGCGGRQVVSMMILALVPLITALGIAVVWDRWTSGRGVKPRMGP